MNLDGIGHIASVEDLIWAEKRSLEGSPDGTLPYKDMRGGSQVFEIEREWRNMPGCWYGQQLSNVDPQLSRKVGAFGGGWGEKFPL